MTPDSEYENLANEAQEQAQSANSDRPLQHEIYQTNKLFTRSPPELHPTFEPSIFTDGTYSYAPREGSSSSSACNNNDTQECQEVKIYEYFDKRTLRRIVGQMVNQRYTDFELEELV